MKHTVSGIKNTYQMASDYGFPNIYIYSLCLFIIFDISYAHGVKDNEKGVVAASRILEKCVICITMINTNNPISKLK